MRLGDLREEVRKYAFFTDDVEVRLFVPGIDTTGHLGRELFIRWEHERPMLCIEGPEYFKSEGEA